MFIEWKLFRGWDLLLWESTTTDIHSCRKASNLFKLPSSSSNIKSQCGYKTRRSYNEVWTPLSWTSIFSGYHYYLIWDHRKKIYLINYCTGNVEAWRHSVLRPPGVGVLFLTPAQCLRFAWIYCRSSNFPMQSKTCSSGHLISKFLWVCDCMWADWYSIQAAPVLFHYTSCNKL